MAIGLAAGAAIGGVAKEIIGGLDALFTSDEERAEGEREILRILGEPHNLQALTNIEEAKHPSVFVSGWRPALGWLCVLLLAYAWIGRDMMIIALSLAGQPQVVADLPVIESGELMTLVLSLLGLGATRSYEKLKGVARVR